MPSVSIPRNVFCLLSFDVEDWFQTENFRELFQPSTWDTLEPRIESSTCVILDLLSRHQIPATFFILGWIAERHPGIVRSILSAGHEVASHGYGHVMPTQQPLADFRADLLLAKETLEQISGAAVHGYRAPCYAIDNDRLRTVFETGHTYDSSYNPVAIHDRYGALTVFTGQVGPGLLSVDGGGLEVVLPVARTWPVPTPISGGGWFRLIPPPLFRHLALAWARQHGHYFDLSASVGIRCSAASGDLRCASCLPVPALREPTSYPWQIGAACCCVS